VPIHNDKEISIFEQTTTMDPTMVPSLLRLLLDQDGSHHDHAGDENAMIRRLLLDQHQELIAVPSDGWILGAGLQSLRDHGKLCTLLAQQQMVPRNLRLFVVHTGDGLVDLQNESTHNHNNNLSIVLEYLSSKSVEHRNHLKTNLQHCVEHGHHTTLVINHATMVHQQDPVRIANDIADCMDATGGGDGLWLAPTIGCSDLSSGATTTNVQEEEEDSVTESVVRLAEELGYLDTPGSTVQSRLMVTAVNEDIVQECMTLGINKFVIGCRSGQGGTEHQRNMIERIALEQGKVLRRSGPKP
jgi:hypothetical protein